MRIAWPQLYIQRNNENRTTILLIGRRLPMAQPALNGRAAEFTQRISGDPPGSA
jgi:hypothetical protein